MEEDRILCSQKLDVEQDQERALRPARFDEFIGQKKITENLKIFIQSAKMRNVTLDHVLLAGPPGLGKTTLALIIAKDMGVSIKATSAPIIEKAGDLVSILTALEANDVLFLDEIHRLSPAIEEILYPALEDRTIDIVIGQGIGARSIKLNLAPFSLIGATTRTGLLTSHFRDRFGINLRLDYYSIEELREIALRSSSIIQCKIMEEAALEIAKRSRRTPRIVNRLLKRVSDFATVEGMKIIDPAITKYALERLDIDDLGLDDMDRKVLATIINKYNGGPVGIKTIAISVSEDIDTLEDYYEPFLVQVGLLKRTPRGRVATQLAYQHLGLKYTAVFDGASQESLFDVHDE